MCLISCSVFKELPHCPFEQCSMSISSSRTLCQHLFSFFSNSVPSSVRPSEYTLFITSLQAVFLDNIKTRLIYNRVVDKRLIYVEI